MNVINKVLTQNCSATQSLSQLQPLGGWTRNTFWKRSLTPHKLREGPKITLPHF
jgi:hypothetical protein